MSIEQNDFDIAVVGAGAIGAACALSMANTNPELRIALIERSKQAPLKDPENQRVWALGHAAMNLLSQLGVSQRLDESSCYPYQRMVVWDANSDGELCFNAEELEQEHLGWMTDAERVTAELQAAACRAPNLDVLFEYPLDTICRDDEWATLCADEMPSIRSRLVVAADGANSWLRRQARIPASRYSYHQRGIVAHIRTENSHQDTAWQRFLSEGPIAVLPLAGNYSSIVWSTSEEQADLLLACDMDEFKRQLAIALDGRLGDIADVGERLSFPLQSRQAERYVDDRLVLIGDAAHSIHPLAGQGANLGFQDVITLSELLRDSDDPAAASLLQQYQRTRRPANLQTDWLMTSLHHSYQFNGLLWSVARGAGMNLLSDSSRVKNWLAKQAMGLGN